MRELSVDKIYSQACQMGGGGSTIQGASVRSPAADYNLNMSLAAVSLGLGDNYDNKMSTLNILTYSLLILYYLYV